MLIHRWKSLSIREKSFSLMLFAVFLPTLILLYSQYLSLAELRDKSKAVFANDLRETFVEIEDKSEKRLLEAANKILQDFPQSGQQPWNREFIEKNLQLILENNPGVESAFVFADQANRFKLGVLSREDGYRESKDIDNPGEPLVSLEGEKAEEDFLLPLVSAFQSSVNRRLDGDYLIAQRRCEKCAVNGQPPTEIFYLYRVLSESKDFTNLRFVGVRLKQDYLIKEFLAPIIAEAVRTNYEKTELELTFGVFDERQQLLYSNDENKILDDFEIKESLNRVFPLFTIAGSFSNNKIADLSNWYFWRGLLLMSLVCGLLVLGVRLLFGVAGREINLAEAKSAFVSNVSHELKTPIALIRLFAETLQSERVKNPEKIQEYYRIIAAESVRLTNLINNILDFSAIEAGRKEYNFAPCDLSATVAEVMRNYNFSLEKAGFKVETDFQDDLPPLDIDCDAISQAVLNLIDNAVKYSGDDKFIRVVVKHRHENIAVEVTDHGIGIAPDEQEKIFGNFYRAGGSSDVHNVKGSGLGLALVKHIVEAHGGQVTVSSVLHRGSTFTILLPIELAYGEDQK